jgi:ATP-dependent Zn protease
MNPEFILYTLISTQITQINSFKTGWILFDLLIGFSLILLCFSIDGFKFKQFVNKKLNNLLINRKNTIVLSYQEKSQKSIKYRAVMYYLSKINNKSIFRIKELNDFEWSDEEHRITELNSEYFVNQTKEFIIDTNITGLITVEKIESSMNRETNTIEVTSILIQSSVLNLVELQDWINKRVDEYKTHLINKSTDGQLLLTISQNGREIECNATKWESTIRFDNSYFNNMHNLIKKIDFFLNNKAWYEKHGIPYNLGILLYGEPGCGKTRFIKQILNYTQRHGIDIKLHDMFDLTKLKTIIFNDEICDNYIIPQDKRIIIFEDIDAFGDMIKERDQKKNNDNKKKSEEVIVLENRTPIDKIKNNNNNLSYLLNIFDGLNECTGRIIIMTTNKIDDLDKALIRPGRIDIKIEFNKCSIFDISKMIKMFWEIDIDEKNIKKELDYKYTSAEVINIFRNHNSYDEIQKLFCN